ncbi:MAG TPA: PLP-dependent aminotransferase family protein [Spirochaetales bacterium]|nr:PLP-dependent aminotransferase family protein [Spirochaetales bacterium]HRY53462.1 PLP-dependent aminotransferase family protein [Spirochaetia bacterium]
MRWFALDRGSSLPLTRQIYGELSSQILGGELRAGERLPSTREAAGELGVSRNVVMEAYEQLAAEGFLLGISGAGTYVAEGSRLGFPSRRPPGPGAPAEPEPSRAPGREEGSRACAIDFRLGRPALDLVPYRAWARLECEARLGAPVEALGGAEPEGQPELREALQAYLWRRRGIDCRPEQIAISSGALQGLSTLASLVLEPGSPVLFEDPGHVLAREAFAARGAAILPIPVDEEGLRTELLPRDSRPALAFVTPSHQFPLGGCLSVQRRVALVEWAREAGCLLVEDDYESEFRYDVGPVSSLQRLDPENVAYVGTFSKVFFPAIRLGYLVLPERLVEGYLSRRRLADRYGAPPPQLAMARFIGEGRLDKHIARMRRIYRGRRDALVGALEAAFPGRARILGRATGLHVAVRFEGLAFGPPLIESIRRAGVILHPVEDYALVKGSHSGTVAMGYSHLEVEEIERGVAILAGIL